MSDLQMPFRPFTVEEVAAITGLPGAAIDPIVYDGAVGDWKTGDDGVTRGLDLQQTFAIYVAAR